MTPVAPAEARRGSPQALLEASRDSRADPEDIQGLMHTTEDARLPTKWAGDFDSGGTPEGQQAPPEHPTAAPPAGGSDTACLLSSPANAARLREALASARRGTTPPMTVE